MSTDLHLPDSNDRLERYQSLILQLPALMDDAVGRIANAANFAAAIKDFFGFHWVGFYFIQDVNGTPELVLGPFQGPVACTRIALGRGVCGTAWQRCETVVVPDVELFPGHIACSSLSRSEIVLPVFSEGRIIGVLDIDSAVEDDFTSLDVTSLQELVKIAERYL